jgi:hypothetical protein
VAYVIPASGAPVLFDGIGIVRGTRQPELARRFYDFVTTPEALRFAADSLLRRGLAQADTLHPTLHEAAFLGWGLVALGDKNRAIRLLGRYRPRADAHFQLHLQRDAVLDPLRSDPAFRALLVRKDKIPGT